MQSCGHASGLTDKLNLKNALNANKSDNIAIKMQGLLYILGEMMGQMGENYTRS